MNRYPDPNKEVEEWKDAVYEQTKNMSHKELTAYFDRGAEKILARYGIKPCYFHYKGNDAL